jgi:outer membrane receptor protein involved in Fe transport
LDTYFRNDDYRGTATFATKVFTGLDVTIGGEFAATSADGTSMPGEILRRHGSGFASARYVILRDASIFREIVVHPTIRLDSFTGVSPSWSPQVALLARFDSLASFLEPFLRASISRNFRVPTFNELYFQGGGGIGNPSLRPEQSKGFEIGGGAIASLAGRQEIGITYFETSMTDRIVWVAAGNFGVTPRNIRSVLSQGIEGSWLWRPFDGPATLRVSYANLTSLKTSRESPGDPNVNRDLVYVPRETAHASVECSVPVAFPMVDRLGGFLGYQYTGSRYTTEDNTNSLPAYHLLDVSLLADWTVLPWRLRTKFEVLNLFDQNYEVVLGYPMPMRSLRLTVNVGY